HEPSRVMIVDDDVVAGHYTQAVLEKAGMVVHLVDDVMNLLDALDAFVPDLFLLDLHMPGGTGVEMARVIRQDDRYAGIPMLFLSGEEETSRQAEALVAGAAGFVQKPARGSVLVPLARAMTRRSRRLRGVASRDPVSGLFNHSYVKLQLGREIDRARREQGRLTYVVFAIDHFSALNAMHGYAVGDTVLRYLAATVTARTRRTDACGRLDGGRFGLVLPNAAPAQAESLLRDIRATLADFEVREGEGAGGLTISCGLADFPTFDAPRAMSQAAEAALQTAREGGGDRVIRGK
ncbi:MAG TPA: response regulator receiver modulated diguanylate cyclase, partial [Rhodospirillaceae bacterium]|nr:response regulator receiver modulated diguanylate cyclase [Rhodospirillaceae bacterium]